MNETKPSISFFGSSLVSAYWNGAATYYRGIIKYLYRLGYKVKFYEPDAFDRQKNRDIPNPYWAKVEVYGNDKSSVEQAVHRASRADILIKASGVGIFDSYLEKALLEIKKPHQLVIFWDVDAPATLDSVFKNTTSPFRVLIPEYDYIFTYGGGPPVIDAYKSLHAKRCVPIYNALDPETHYRVKNNPKFECDLAFLGNRLPDRESRVEEFFIEVARLLPDKKFILGGSGWEDMPLPLNTRYMGHIYTNEHNIFNSSPEIILNISRKSMADYGFSPATRIFEAAGAGACIITDAWKGIETFFAPEKEILIAENGNDVISLLKSISTERKRRTGQAARLKVLKKHTYEQRAMQVNNILLKQDVLMNL